MPSDDGLRAAAGDHAVAALERLVDAVLALGPQPRTLRWQSLTYCVVDATWSIGSRYDAVVVPLVRRLASDFDDQEPLVGVRRPLPADPVPLKTFDDRYSNASSLMACTNEQRTSSSRGAPHKAEVVLGHARILLAHGVDGLLAAQVLLDDEKRFAAVNQALRRLPGEGAHGIRRGYLWMLAGDNETVKPDRMIMRWLSANGVTCNPTQASALLTLIARELTAGGRPISPWEVDHAVWREQRSRRPARAGRSTG